jgi:hypothetical protein
MDLGFGPHCVDVANVGYRIGVGIEAGEWRAKHREINARLWHFSEHVRDAIAMMDRPLLIVL